MKKISAILLLSVCLLSYAEFHQLLKLPILFEHYKEHRQLDETITFWSFIRIHYFDKIVVDEDYQRDQQLPLRNADGCQMVVNNIGECRDMAFELSIPKDTPCQFTLHNEMSKLQFISFDIFQPPRAIC